MVQHFRGRGAKQRPAKEASVCRHDDEIEFVLPGKLSDLCRGIARQQDSRALTDWKLRLEERIEFVSCNVLLLFGNLGKWAHIELECVMTVIIQDVNPYHPSSTNHRPPLHTHT